MVYLLETKLPENKPVYFALAYIYGIGIKTSGLICKKLGFSTNLKVKDLTREQSIDLLKFFESSDLIISNDLKKFKSLSFRKLISIKAYRGLRKERGFPIRGQRTHTNAKSSRKINRQR